MLHACSPTRDSPSFPQHTREVVPPQRTDLVLTAHIPDIELCVLVCDGFDVEANGGNCRYVLVKLEFVEDSWVHVLVLSLYSVFWAAYWSFLLHRDPTSTGASPWIRRSCPSFLRLRHPCWQYGGMLGLNCACKCAARCCSCGEVGGEGSGERAVNAADSWFTQGSMSA